MVHLKPAYVRILAAGLVVAIVVLRLIWPVNSAVALLAVIVIGSLLVILLIHFLEKFFFQPREKPQDVVGADESGGHGEGRLNF